MWLWVLSGFPESVHDASIAEQPGTAGHRKRSPCMQNRHAHLVLILEYHGARETLWESGTTIVPRLNTHSDR